MKRLLAAGCALGFTGAGLVAFAGPGSAEDPPAEPTVPKVEYVQLEASVTPAAPTVGGDFTIAPVDNCSVADPEDPGTVDWIVYGDGGTPDDEEDDTFDYEQDVPLAADGSWPALTFGADVAENVYFWADCYAPNWEELDEICFPVPPVEEGGEEAKQLAAATNDDEHPTTTEDTTTTTTTVPEEPVECVFEYYEMQFKVGNPPAPVTPPAKPIPGVGPLTG